MMRPIVVSAPADKPAALTIDQAFVNGDAVLTWLDPTQATDGGTWGNPANEVGYRVYRAPLTNGKAGDFVALNREPLANAEKFTDPGVTEGQYAYKVVAFNAAGEGPDSNIVGEFAPPDAPTGLTATPSAVAKSVLLEWTAAKPNGSALQSYTLQRRSGANWILVDSAIPGNATSYTISAGLAASTSYQWRIWAVNGAGVGAIGTFAALTTPAGASAPTSVTTVRGATGSRAVTVSWSGATAPAAAPITGYTVSWGQTPNTTGGPGSPVDVSAGTASQLVTGLVTGRTYTFRVTANNAWGSNGRSANPVQAR